MGKMPHINLEHVYACGQNASQEKRRAYVDKEAIKKNTKQVLGGYSDYLQFQLFQRQQVLKHEHMM